MDNAIDVANEFDTRELDEIIAKFQEEGMDVTLCLILKEFIRRFNMHIKSQQGISSMLFRMIKEAHDVS